MRLIADGAVDRDGVTGLAARLGYSDRQLSWIAPRSPVAVRSIVFASTRFNTTFEAEAGIEYSFPSRRAL